MLAVSTLISEVEGTLRRGSDDERARTLARLTDLFLLGAPTFGRDQVALFDVVIQRFAATIELRARMELADRLAPVGNAPPGVLSMLAVDEIAVARPVLAGSPCLDDQQLMRVALDRGRDHMLAICERDRLSTAVTDVLVEMGDGPVRHAVVGNAGARFSPGGTATLIAHAREDPRLCGLLGERTDLSALDVAQIIAIAKAEARARLLAAMPGEAGAVGAAVERSAASVASAAAARNGMGAVSLVGTTAAVPTEDDLAALAADGRRAEALAAMGIMIGLSVAALQRIFEEPQNDLLIVLGKAQGWSWKTVRALLRLRDPSLTDRHHFHRAEETFDALASATASRVVHVLRLREPAPPRP